MSPNRTRELFEVYTASAGNRLTYDDYELVVSRKTHYKIRKPT